MNNETQSPLLLTKLSVVILAIVFLSGVAEIACLAFYAHKNNYSVFNEFKPATGIQTSQKSSMILAAPAMPKHLN